MIRPLLGRVGVLWLSAYASLVVAGAAVAGTGSNLLPLGVAMVIAASLVAAARLQAHVARARTGSPELSVSGAEPSRKRLANALVISTFASQLTWDYLASTVQGVAGGVILLLAVLLALMSTRFEDGRWRLALTGLVIVAVSLAAASAGADTVDLGGAGRLFTLLIGAVALGSCRHLVSVGTVVKLSVATVLLACVNAVVAGQQESGGIVRFAPFVVRSESVHPSAYLLLIALAGVWIGRRRKQLPPTLSLAALLAGGLTLIGYRVATTIVMAAVAIVLVALGERGARTARRVPALVAMTVLVAVFFQSRATTLEETTGSTGADGLSSGRLTTWGERLSIVEGRSAFDLVFGTGPNSDRFRSSAWAGLKDSHNDLLRSLIELGLVGSLGLVLVLVAANRFLGPRARPIMGAVLVASLLSNGLLFRPMLGLLAIAVAATMCGTADRPRGHVEREPQLANHDVDPVGEARVTSRTGR